MRFAFVVIAALCLSAHAVSAKTQVCPRHGSHKTSRTPTGVDDGSFVTNGIVRLGVSKYGTLNVLVPQWEAESYSDINYDGKTVGLQYTGYQIGGKFPDATAPGCYCEGWGLSAKDTDNNVAEGAHSANDGVLGGLTAVSHDSPNALEVISHTQVAGNGVSILVEHHFRPSPKTPNLYEVNVTVTNNGALPIKELKYVRTMDWDVPPTSFDDCLDINMGSAGDEGGDIECVHSNGQTIPLPTQFVDEVNDAIIRLGRCFDPAVTNKSVEKAGPYDSGSAWLFNFHDITEANPLVVGESRNWLVYYGAADNDVQANQVLAAASIEAYTYGYPNKNDACPRDGVRFIFGFGKVGGDIIIPNCVDDPNCIIRNVQGSCSSSHASVSTETGTCVSLNFGGSDSCNP